MKKVALIGTGRHGSRYGQHIYQDINGLQLAGISRQSTDLGREQASNWCTTFYDNWRALVAEPDVDAVISVTPPVLNLEVARECAKLSKPLLIEKPLARNVKEAEEILRIMAAAGASLTVGQTLRYNPVIQALRAALSGMGQLYSFYANQRLEPSTLTWHDDRDMAGAGVLFHTAVHVFDALKTITGLRVRRVMAHGQRIHAKVLEDLVLVIVELENGVLGTVDVSKIGLARTGRFEFVCQGGQLHGDQIHASLESITGNAVHERQRLVQEPTILHLLQDWRDFLEGCRPNPVPGEEGLSAVRACEACLISMEKQCWVEV
jgi:predicted dehydrogenase